MYEWNVWVIHLSDLFSPGNIQNVLKLFVLIAHASGLLLTSRNTLSDLKAHCLLLSPSLFFVGGGRGGTVFVRRPAVPNPAALPGGQVRLLPRQLERLENMYQGQPRVDDRRSTCTFRFMFDRPASLCPALVRVNPCGIVATYCGA